MIYAPLKIILRTKFNSSVCNQIRKFTSKPNVGRLPKKLPIGGVKNVILVSSAKGGVGKSLISVNLAFALKHLNQERQVGILDADVYGPSLPMMTGLKGSPQVNKQKMMLPLVNFGVKCMSMGFLVDEEDPIVWRGLMVMSAMEKLLRSVYWGELDILIIDMPPGTGDTQLSVVQNIPINGVIVVTTPQKVALSDVIRGVKMFRSLDTNVLGFVQNMAYFKCPNCTHHDHLFGQDVSKHLSEKLNIDHLADVPIDSELSLCSDTGKPIIIQKPESDSSKIFYELANKVTVKLNL